uniref:Fibronectin type-III domain-containing protein n=1 Tax=Magallana gigas TaxID=29159 RepID=K1PTQ6_MAGGI
MKAYRAVLDSGPDITSCRIYYLCLDVCNNTILGPPKDTCTISNDTTLMEHQTIMYLLVDNLRLGTTYTLSVVGYNEAGEGKNPRRVSLTTKSKRPDQVEIGSFNFDKQRYIVTWRSPSFPGEDLRYNVSLEDALREYVVLSSNNRNELGAPQGPKIIEYTCERIKITWFEPDVRVRNGPITGYKFKNKDGIYAFSSISNQEANIITIRKFQSTECPKDNTPEIVGIVFAFLILLGICLAVIIFVYRKKVREIALLLTGTSSFTSDINGRPTRCFATSFALTEDLIVARNEIVSS